MSRVERRQLRNGLLFAAPWLIGLLTFLAYPIVSSAYLSFCDYSTLQPPVWIGVQNYRDLTGDQVFYKSLRNTFVLAALVLPAGMTTALFIATLLNSGVRGLTVFRTIFYLPSLVPIVASALLWLWVFNGQYGILNYALDGALEPVNHLVNGTLAACGSTTRVHLAGPTWLGDPLWAKPALAIMVIWGMGGTMIVYLAGLQDVPRELYEAAEIDGAGWWRRLFHVTLPCLSPVIYFTLIMGLIGIMQFFAAAYIMGGGPMGGSAGNPARSTLFYTVYLWAQAFEYLHMGYACAMAWIMFLIILALTLIAHRTAARRVTYLG
ncbi:MAG: sugar ABC transporter permease [Planctomycetes bacterium]|nr:sugar ABC transporter permease [Planctomycetota bacterium]